MFFEKFIKKKRRGGGGGGGGGRNVMPYLPPFRYAVFKDFHSTES